MVGALGAGVGSGVGAGGATERVGAAEATIVGGGPASGTAAGADSDLGVGRVVAEAKANTLLVASTIGAHNGARPFASSPPGAVAAGAAVGAVATADATVGPRVSVGTTNAICRAAGGPSWGE